MKSNKKALCFVFDHNYLYQGKHAVMSAKKYNPDHTTILLTDQPIDDGIVDVQIRPEQLGLSEKTWMIVGRVAILEFVITNLNFDTAILIDGDTYSYNTFSELQTDCENHSIVVIPHITQPLPSDNKFPQNTTISLAGNYNAGIVGVSKTGLNFIRWWKNQTSLFPISRPEIGLANEQGWLRFAPDFDDNTKIFKHPGYNVAYWNIKQRNIELDNGIFKIDNHNLCIMHFSGLKKEMPPEAMSIFQNRYILSKDDLAYQIFADYKSLIWGAQNA